jgi:hypothetical protein
VCVKGGGDGAGGGVGGQSLPHQCLPQGVSVTSVLQVTVDIDTGVCVGGGGDTGGEGRGGEGGREEGRGGERAEGR